MLVWNNGGLMSDCCCRHANPCVDCSVCCNKYVVTTIDFPISCDNKAYTLVRGVPTDCNWGLPFTGAENCDGYLFVNGSSSWSIECLSTYYILQLGLVGGHVSPPTSFVGLWECNVPFNGNGCPTLGSYTLNPDPGNFSTDPVFDTTLPLHVTLGCG